MIKFAPIEETMVFGQTQLYKFDAIYKKELEVSITIAVQIHTMII